MQTLNVKIIKNGECLENMSIIRIGYSFTFLSSFEFIVDSRE